MTKVYIGFISSDKTEPWFATFTSKKTNPSTKMTMSDNYGATTTRTQQ